MTVNKLGGIASAVLAIAAVIGGVIGFFEPRAHAEDQAKQQAKSVNELRKEFYLSEIAKLNAKPKPTKDDADLKDRYMAMVKAIEEAEKVKR